MFGHTPDMANVERELFDLAAGYAVDYLDSLGERPVGATASAAELTELLGGGLPAGPTSGADALRLLAEAAEAGGVVASSGPRYFGYVVGGTLPVSVATDWLVSAWDQNAGVFDLGPAVATIEHITAEWLIDLFGLPAGTSVGFPTGCTMAHVAALAAARHHVLAKVGWNVEQDGLQGAPKVHVLVGEQRHMTIDLALRYLGFGAGTADVVATDDQGAMRADALRDALSRHDGPTIVCAQVGEINSGAIDPVADICAAAHERGAWVHVDGAFGLWAAASPTRRSLVEGVAAADSWASDAHKWLNVPYDCGLVFVAHPSAHKAAMMDNRPGFLPVGTPGRRDGIDWVTDLSRRARGVPVWAALRTLGRSGVAELIDGCCVQAERFATALAEVPGVDVLNDVVLNQVIVRFADDDDVTRNVTSGLQRGGVCWFGGTTWRGRHAMRISVTSWRTGPDDVDRSVDEIIAVFERVMAGSGNRHEAA